MSLRARVAVYRRRGQRLLTILTALGAILLLLGIWAGYSGGCFGNFAFGGVSCYLWGFQISQTALTVIFWGLITGGIAVMAGSLLVKYTF